MTDLKVYLRQHGLFSFVQLLIGSLFDLFFDISRNVSTAGFEQVGSFFYAPSRSGGFRQLLKSQQIPNDLAFVDYGAGKGKAMIMALDFGFQIVRGIEISRNLYEIAIQNLNSMKKVDQRADQDIEVILGDMTEYQPKQNDGVFYFYDPAPMEVVAKCLVNIFSSLKSHPRNAWIIYHNNLISSSEIEKQMTELVEYQGVFKSWGNFYYVFRFKV